MACCWIIDVDDVLENPIMPLTPRAGHSIAQLLAYRRRDIHASSYLNPPCSTLNLVALIDESRNIFVVPL